jgi:hypothetical protein
MTTSGTVIAVCTQGGIGEGGRYMLRTSARYVYCMALQSDVRLSRAINMYGTQHCNVIKLMLLCSTLFLYSTLPCHILSLSEPCAVYPTKLNFPVTRELKKMIITK